uniref:Uncharacterized protein n=1 Tax=Spongospora subterranea TaxID=70186 RepID=A0A0H5R4Y5_9EUKA|eukprot:CRZ08946.1 hypothetical protein [Spongospora subterranea]
MDEQKKAMERAKLVAKVIKEGGKKGVEIEGVADMGGLKFFVTNVDTPEGDMDLLTECMNAMNAKVDEGAEERKGGSGAIGKLIFSCDAEKLLACAYVPTPLAADINVLEWLNDVLSKYSGKILCAEPEVEGGFMAKGYVDVNAEAGVFPLKIRDPALKIAIQYLIGKGQFPDDDDDEEEEEAMGDDFFDTLDC